MYLKNMEKICILVKFGSINKICNLKSEMQMFDYVTFTYDFCIKILGTRPLWWLWVVTFKHSDLIQTANVWKKYRKNNDSVIDCLYKYDLQCKIL